MAGKGILPEHEAECSVELIVGYFPCHKSPVRKIRCQKRLADPPDRPRVQHSLNPRKTSISSTPDNLAISLKGSRANPWIRSSATARILELTASVCSVSII